jgi:hypothetical protein
MECDFKSNLHDFSETDVPFRPEDLVLFDNWASNGNLFKIEGSPVKVPVKIGDETRDELCFRFNCIIGYPKGLRDFYDSLIGKSFLKAENMGNEVLINGMSYSKEDPTAIINSITSKLNEVA